MQRPIPAEFLIPLRLLQLFVGLSLCGVAVAAMVRARLGLGPWDVLHEGLANRTGLSIGTVVIMTSALVLVLWLPLRQRPRIGTLLNVLTIGLVADATLAITSSPDEIPVRFALLAFGIIGVGLGTGIYLGAGLGAGSRDGLMTGLAERYSVPVFAVRTLIELTVLALGWLIGGRAGIGTIAFAFLTGPVVHAALPRCQYRNWIGKPALVSPPS